MSEDKPSGQILLTLDDARCLMVERDQVARDYKELGQRLDHLNKQVEALSFFLPKHLHERLLDPPHEEVRQRKWAPTIFRLLEDAGHGLTTADIRSGLAGTHLEGEVGLHGNALYNALSKIVSKGELDKVGVYYCLPGQKPPRDGSTPVSAHQIEADVISILGQATSGLKSMEIVEHILRNDMPSANSMKRSTGSFYRALALLVAAGKVARNGRLYHAPPKENEPSDVAASDGSDAGSGGERRRALRLI